jgi:hypothetical protein
MQRSLTSRLEAREDELAAALAQADGFRDDLEAETTKR